MTGRSRGTSVRAARAHATLTALAPYSHAQAAGHAAEAPHAFADSSPAENKVYIIFYINKYFEHITYNAI